MSKEFVIEKSKTYNLKYSPFLTNKISNIKKEEVEDTEGKFVENSEDLSANIENLGITLPDLSVKKPYAERIDSHYLLQSDIVFDNGNDYSNEIEKHLEVNDTKNESMNTEYYRDYIRRDTYKKKFTITRNENIIEPSYSVVIDLRKFYDFKLDYLEQQQSRNIGHENITTLNPISSTSTLTFGETTKFYMWSSIKGQYYWAEIVSPVNFECKTNLTKINDHSFEIEVECLFVRYESRFMTTNSTHNTNSKVWVYGGFRDVARGTCQIYDFDIKITASYKYYEAGQSTATSTNTVINFSPSTFLNNDTTIFGTRLLDYRNDKISIDYKNGKKMITIEMPVCNLSNENATIIFDKDVGELPKIGDVFSVKEKTNIKTINSDVKFSVVSVEFNYSGSFTMTIKGKEVNK